MAKRVVLLLMIACSAFAQPIKTVVAKIDKKYLPKREVMNGTHKKLSDGSR